MIYDNHVNVTFITCVTNNYILKLFFKRTAVLETHIHSSKYYNNSDGRDVCALWCVLYVMTISGNWSYNRTYFNITVDSKKYETVVWINFQW